MAVRALRAVVDDLRCRDLLELVEEVAARRGVLVSQVCGTARTLSVSRARHETWWRIRHHPERSYSFFEIGRLFGRHHTTIMAGVATHARRLRPIAIDSAANA
jgi:chromosomal replication initiation ATPase DnaA